MEEEISVESCTTKYRGLVDFTIVAQESSEDKEDLHWPFLCPDAADQELDSSTAWQIAAHRLQIMQQQSAAIEKEEQLAEDLAVDKVGRKHLLQTPQEFQAALDKMSSSTFLVAVEKSLS